MERLLGYIKLKSVFWAECVGEQSLGGATWIVIKQDLLQTALKFLCPLKDKINLKRSMG